MLIDFSVKNYKSIKDEVHLNMVFDNEGKKGSLSSEKNCINFVQLNTPDDETLKICPIMALFGANASGKSNILKAFVAMRAIVIRGFVENYYEPFRFSEKTERAPTEFILTFSAKDKNDKDVVYEYGLEYTARGITHEYLNRIEKEQDTLVFDTNKFDTIPQNAWHLFITNRTPIINIVNRPDFNPVFNKKTIDLTDCIKVKDFFENLFVADDINLFPMPKEDEIDSVKNILNKMFYRMDMNFKDINIQTKTERVIEQENIYSGDDRIFVDINKIEDAKRNITKQNPDCLITFNIDDEKKEAKCYAHKITMEYDKELFDGSFGTESMNYTNEESTGTKNLFRFFCVLIDAIKNNKIIVFDEIDRTIHTELIKFIFFFVHTKLGAQLICSSHNPCVMNNLGKYEICLIDRKKDLSTSLNLLSNFKFSEENPDFADLYSHKLLGGVPRVIKVLDNVEV